MEYLKGRSFRKINKGIWYFLFEILLIVLAFFYFIPILMMILGSLKSSEEAAIFSKLLPTVWKFDNYLIVMKTGKLISSFFNSLCISFFSIFITVILASLASFIIARRNTKLSGNIYKLFIAGLVAPLMYIPTIKVLNLLHLMNTRTGVILVVAATNLPFAVFLFSGFMKGIPKEFDESAIVDGCNAIRIYNKIILPLLRPVILAQVIILFVFAWNDISTPLFFLNSSKKWTMPLLVYNFVSQYVRNWNYVFAYSIIITIPVVIIFVTMQKYFVSGLMAGSIKG